VRDIEMDEDYSSFFSSPSCNKLDEMDEVLISSIILSFSANNQDEMDKSLFSSSSIPSIPAKKRKEMGRIQGDNQTLPILPGIGEGNRHNLLKYNKIRQDKLSHTGTTSFPDDVNEFISLCEQGILYDELMRRLGIPTRRRKSFKRLFYSQVFFGKVKQTGRVTQLFARDFPTVYQAICELKRKDYRRMAYLLQAHESKLMIDIIARRILAEMPGTFVGTIHDSIMTTSDQAEAVRAIMLEEFGRFGLRPTIRLETY
jgi:hypothetical protein